MKLISSKRLRHLAQRGRKNNELMLMLADIRVNGHAPGMKITLTGKGEVEKVKIDDALQGKATQIESSFLRACNDARTKMHELKQYHWEQFYDEGKNEKGDFQRFQKDHPDQIREVVESFANDPDNDPLPPFTYDTSLKHIQILEDYCTENNIDVGELLENWNNLGEFLENKGINAAEFEDRVLVPLQDEDYSIPREMKDQLRKRISDFLKVEGKYDILNTDEVDMEYVEKLEKERSDALWKTENGGFDLESRRNMFTTIQQHLIDPEFHGIISADDIEAMKRLLIDTESDVTALFENTPMLKDIAKNADLHYAITRPRAPAANPMPEAKSLEDILKQFKEALRKISQPPENPIESTEEFKKLKFDDVELVQVLTSGRVEPLVDYLSREDIRQRNYFLKQKFGYTGTLTPEIKEAMNKEDPELAKEMEEIHAKQEAGRELALKWHKENPNRGLLYGATASEIASLVGLTEEQKKEMLPDLAKMRTPL